MQNTGKIQPPAYRLACVGAGVMSTAIVRGAVGAGLFGPGDICVSDRSEERLAEWRQIGCAAMPDNRSAVSAANTILLGVRPADAADLLPEIDWALNGKTLISICAGLSVEWFRARLSADVAIVRVMPNLPMRVGAGMTVVAESEPESAESALRLMRASGLAITLPESLMDAVTAVSGSGPGYCFCIAAAMQRAAEQMGLPADAARTMIAQTLRGAAEMLLEPGAEAEELAAHVATPGGTTQAALVVMRDAGLDSAVQRGMEACRRRAAELGR